MKNCPNCQREYPDQAGFCGYCGIPLPEAAPLVQQPAYSAPEAAQAPRKKGLPKWIWFLAGGVLLAGLAVLGVLFLPKLLRQEGGNVRILSHEGTVYGISSSGKVVSIELEYGGSYMHVLDGSAAYFQDRDQNLWYFAGERFQQLAEGVSDYVVSLNGRAAFVTEQQLYLFDGEKSQLVAEDVSFVNSLTPDGTVVGYNRLKSDGTLQGFYFDGQENSLGKGNTLVAISQNRQWIYYYSNSKSRLYVQNGTDSKTRETICNGLYYCILNKSGTQMIVLDDNGTYFVENGQPVKLSGGIWRLQQADGVNYSLNYTNLDSLKGQLYYGSDLGGTSKKMARLTDRLELQQVGDRNYDTFVWADHTAYYSKNKSLYQIDPLREGAEAERLLSNCTEWRAIPQARLLLFVDDEGNTMITKNGRELFRLQDEWLDLNYCAAALGDGFLYIDDSGRVLYTEGGKGNPISGLGTAEARYLEAVGRSMVIIYCNDGEVYFTADGKTAVCVWD